MTEDKDNARRLEPEYNKYTVLKNSEIFEYLGEHDAHYLLKPLLDKINAGRFNHGKGLNTYLVVNTDEPYAEKIQNMILTEGNGYVELPLRIGTTIVDKDEHGEYYMIQCATEQAAQRRMGKCLN